MNYIVNTSMIQMNDMTQQNAAVVEQATFSSQAMKEQALKLKREVDFFQLDGVREEAAPQGATLEKTPEVAPKAAQKTPGATVQVPTPSASQKSVGVRSAKREGAKQEGDRPAKTHDEFEEL